MAFQFVSWALGIPSSAGRSKRATQEDRSAVRLPSLVTLPSEVHTATFQVEGSRYIASSLSEGETSYRPATPSLVTVFRVPSNQEITEGDIEHAIKLYKRSDDVFSLSFLQGVVFIAETREGSVGNLTSAAEDLLKSHNNQWIDKIDEPEWAGDLLPGVYIASKGALYQVFRVYDDIRRCFVSTFITTGSDMDHHALLASAGTPITDVIAVPSRMRAIPTNAKPLNGLRVAVKDNFHIKDIPTSVCNWSYYNTYSPPLRTASMVAQLESDGMYVVGTTRLAAFAATEEPLECVDFGAPWNPRADGHQSPAGSSSGSGAAVASYDWLDIAIGTDTSGSGRRPAHWNGTFGLRPTHGVFDVEGIVPSFPQFDTPTLFARDIEFTCQRIDIVVLEDYLEMITNKDQMDLINAFMADLERILGVKQNKCSFEKIWDKEPPEEAGRQVFEEYMEASCRDSFFYEDYHNFDDFRAKHKKKFNSTPYISPPVRAQWELSKTITSHAHDEAIRRLEVFRKWFMQKFMPADTLTLILIPIENMSPRYRDVATTSFYPSKVLNLFLSPILGAPELTIPIGEVPFESKITGNIEYLPVAVSILAPPNSDTELLHRMRRFLTDSDRPKSVTTGARMFSPK